MEIECVGRQLVTCSYHSHYLRKSLNLLLFQGRQVKICDFGLSRVKTECTMLATQRVGTAAWMCVCGGGCARVPVFVRVRVRGCLGAYTCA